MSSKTYLSFTSIKLDVHLAATASLPQHAHVSARTSFPVSGACYYYSLRRRRTVCMYSVARLRYPCMRKQTEKIKAKRGVSGRRLGCSRRAPKHVTLLCLFRFSLIYHHTYTYVYILIYHFEYVHILILKYFKRIHMKIFKNILIF